MVITPHMLTGAVVGTWAHSRKQAVAFGALSHLALDMIPHRDYSPFAAKGLLLASDLASGTVLTTTFVAGDERRLWAAFGGIVPDLFAFGERAIHLRLTVVPHEWIHSSKTVTRTRTAIAGQALVVLIAIGLLKRHILTLEPEAELINGPEIGHSDLPESS